MPFLSEARLVDGLRLYVIGDVHGRDDCLEAVHRAVAADLVERPARDAAVVHVGDYVDRGPSSRGVLDRLTGPWTLKAERLCLMGNHEDQLLAFLSDPLTAAPTWLTFGGVQTLDSYGVDAGAVAVAYHGPEADRRAEGGGISLGPEAITALATRLAAAMPPAHRAFLESLPLGLDFGDFFVCHAGIRPGVGFADQTRHDLLWIREPFLSDESDFGKVVVHGHTPNRFGPEICPNRINVDTMAFATGHLTCLVLEGGQYRFL